MSKASETLCTKLYNVCIAWKEDNRLVCQLYRNLFFYLENEGLLDPLNETDLYCLHKVFLAKINHSLEEFKRQYNNHTIQTEGNQTHFSNCFVQGCCSMSTVQVCRIYCLVMDILIMIMVLKRKDQFQQRKPVVL